MRALAVCGALLGLLGLARPVTAGVVLTVRVSNLYRLESNQLVDGGALPALVELKTVDGRDDLTLGGVAYRPVQREAGAVGWVRRIDLVDAPAPGPAAETLPALIAQQPVKLRRAWAAVAAAVQENERLGSPLPDPLFARAELWAMAGNYDSAIEDLLSAAVISRHHAPTTADRLKLLNRLEGLLAERVKFPREPYRGDATVHLQEGRELYYQGRVGEALTEFATGVQLQPDDKTLWYFRALAHKRVGDDMAAERDVVMAVFLERHETPREPPEWLHQFERVQGPLRQWMESYRRGIVYRP